MSPCKFLIWDKSDTHYKYLNIGIVAANYNITTLLV